MTRERRSEIVNEISRCLIAVQDEFGKLPDNYSIIGPYEFSDDFLGSIYVKCETIGRFMLGNVSYKMSRMFEDIQNF